MGSGAGHSNEAERLFVEQAEVEYQGTWILARTVFQLLNFQQVETSTASGHSESHNLL